MRRRLTDRPLCYRRTTESRYFHFRCGKNAARRRGDKINVVESSGPIVVFRKCIDSLGVSQNAKFYSGVIIDLITSGAKAANTLPKHIYGSVCMDNTTTNYAAFALIKPIFPKPNKYIPKTD